MPPERHSLCALSLIHLAAIHTGPLSDGLITQPGQVKERGTPNPTIANGAAHSFPLFREELTAIKRGLCPQNRSRVPQLRRRDSLAPVYLVWQQALITASFLVLLLVPFST
nr:MAG TPA: hypothetical protein [Caudoviricetes sp.]